MSAQGLGISKVSRDWTYHGDNGDKLEVTYDFAKDTWTFSINDGDKITMSGGLAMLLGKTLKFDDPYKKEEAL